MFLINGRFAGVVASAALLGSVTAAPAPIAPVLPSEPAPFPPGHPFHHPVPSHSPHGHHSIAHSSINTLPTIEPFNPMPTDDALPSSGVNVLRKGNDAKVTGTPSPRPINPVPGPVHVSTHGGNNITLTSFRSSGVIPTGRPCEILPGSGPGPVDPHNSCIPHTKLPPPLGDPHTTDDSAPVVSAMPSLNDLEQRDDVIVTITETAPDTTWTHTFTVPGSWMTGSPEAKREVNNNNTTTTTTSTMTTTTPLTWPTHGWPTHGWPTHHHHHSHPPNATKSRRPHNSHADAPITSSVSGHIPGQPTIIPGLEPQPQPQLPQPPFHRRPTGSNVVPPHESGGPTREPRPHTEGIDARSAPTTSVG